MNTSGPLDSNLRVDALIVGGGPAGLSAATELARRGHAARVALIEREDVVGGIPRHCAHRGFGLRDLHRFLCGPAYARRLTERALEAGARLFTQSMMTHWCDRHAVQVTSPRGRHRIEARAVVLATGARERSRAARLIAGDRVAGVLTTGQLQDLVHVHGRSVGTRAVIVGAEWVSWSAVLTLRHAGCKPVLMVSSQAQAEAGAAATLLGRLGLRVPVVTRSRVSRIVGRERVSAVEIEALDTGERRMLPCDTVVLTGSWIPDHELARAAELTMDPESRGPLVDTTQATSSPGIFAIGNLTHPVDAADVAALDGLAVAEHVLAFLDAPERAGCADRADGADAAPYRRVLPGDGLRWISPGWMRGHTHPPRDRFLCWPSRFVRQPLVTVSQGGRTLARRGLLWPVSPGQVLRLPAALLASGRACAEPLVVSLAEACASSP